MKKYLMVSSALAGLIIFNTQALAQWQVPNHSTPIGRGPGVTGFNSAAPGAAGGVLTSNGTGSDPTFQPASPAGVPFSLCNGTDQTTYMQNILNGAAKGAFVPQGLICASQIGITIPAGKSLEIANAGEIKKFGSSNNVLITAGGNNVSLIAHGTGAVNMNSDPLGNVTFQASGVSGLLIDGVNFKNGTLHDIYWQDVTNSKVTNNSFTNNAYFSNMIVYTLAADAANLTISYNDFDRTAMAGNCIFFVPQNGHTVSRVFAQENRCSGPAGDTSPDEHSLLVMLGTILDQFPGINVKDNFAFNMNFPYSVVGASEGTFAGNGCDGGGTPGGGTYGYEVALNTNVGYANNHCRGAFIFAGAVAIINTSTGISWSGGVLENTSATANAQGIQVIETAPQVGKRNVISATTIKVAGGYGITVNGDDTILNANVLDGSGTGISPFLFNVGGNRVVTSNFETGWTGAKFSGAVASDTICANNSGGCKIPSSYSGDTGGELVLGGGGANLHSEVSTLSTGTPILASTHRGNANTGEWSWRNGTNSATTRMYLTKTGEFNFNTVVAPATPAAGIAAVYVDSTTKALTSKDDAGAVHTTIVGGTGVLAALAVNVGTPGSFVVNGGALGSPSSAGTIPAFTLGGTITAVTPTFSSGGNTVLTVSTSFSNSPGTGFDIDTVGDSSVALIKFNKSGISRGQMTYLHNATASLEEFNFNAAGTSIFSAIGGGQLAVKPTSVSTSKTTGSLVNAGGLGNAGALYTDTLNVITMANAATTSAVCYNTATGLLTYNGTAGICSAGGLSATKTVRDAAGTGTCSLIFTNGILTGGTC